jgi:hypothetical protein
MGPLLASSCRRCPPLPASIFGSKDGRIVYVGQTRTTLSKRLGPNGYSLITPYNTLAREPGRTNGGQQTNCHVNALANRALAAGRRLTIWYRVTRAEDARSEEARWMAAYGRPDWNRRYEQYLVS